MMRLRTTMMRSRRLSRDTASGVSCATCAALSGLSGVPLRTTMHSEEYTFPRDTASRASLATLSFDHR